MTEPRKNSLKLNLRFNNNMLKEFYNFVSLFYFYNNL